MGALWRVTLLIFLSHPVLAERQFYDDSIPGLGLDDSEEDFYRVDDDGYWVPQYDDDEDVPPETPIEE